MIASTKSPSLESSTPFELGDSGFDFTRYLFRRFTGREFQWLADRNPHEARARPDAVRLAHFEQAVNTHRQDGDPQIGCQQADTGTKWHEACRLA